MPTAIHVVGIGQAREFNRVPKGMEAVRVQSVRSTVVSEVPPPPVAMPVETQVVEVADEMEVSEETEG